jgi:leucyl-tRNA---protein transferase
MSIMPSQHRPLQTFHRSAPAPCPYLPEQTERKLFTRLEHPGHRTEVNAVLTRAGFRRSHDVAYRPMCPSCSACVPVRVLADRFAPSRVQRRIQRRNADLLVTAAQPVADEERYALFAAYQRARHRDSDMSQMGFADFAAMIEEGRADTWLFEARAAEGALLGAMLVDRVDDGYSAIYSFYDPHSADRSLGVFLILSMLRQCREEAKPHLYLGYWIERSPKMAYKKLFQPFEVLGEMGWRLFT